jgi:hypothetical protein
MPKPKPLVTAALICERVLNEKDGVISAVRIVDVATAPAPDPNLAPNIMQIMTLSMLVMVKAGDVRGEHQFSVKVRLPSGRIEDIDTWTFAFDNEASGANIIAGLHVPVIEEGLWWFDVLFDGEFLTSAPLKLARAARPESPAPDTRSGK